MLYKKILVVYKKSSLQLAKERNQTNILGLINNKNKVVAKYKLADKAHSETLDFIRKSLPNYFKDIDYKYDVSPTDSQKYDLFITVGGDGTFLWASKFADNKTPILGINSSSETSVGFYTVASTKKQITSLLLNVSKDLSFKSVCVQRLAIEINGKRVRDRILNDVLFSAKHPANMTNYSIQIPNAQTPGLYITEEQRSSGIWISAPGGSTGANLSAGGWILPLTSPRGQFVVREPMKNFVWGTEYKHVHGFFNKGMPLKIICKTNKALLSCDGTSLDIPVTLGDKIEIYHSKEPLIILGKGIK